MRAAGLAAIFLLVSAAARADDEDERPRFWDRVLRPHAAEVDKLLEEGGGYRDRAAQLYEAQQAAQRQRLLVAAERRFSRAAELEPRNPRVLRDLAITAADLGDFARVAAALAPCRDAVLQDRQLITTLAVAYIKLRRWDEAIELLERVLGGDAATERGPLLDLLGYAYMGGGRLEDAIDAYSRAVNDQPSANADAIAMTGLAVAYDRDEQVGRAAETLERVRQLNPEFPHLTSPPLSTAVQVPFSPPGDRHYWLALAYEAQKRLPEAAAAWRAYLDAPAVSFRRRAEAHLRQVGEDLARQVKHP